MSKKKNILELIDRDWGNPSTIDIIKDYICNTAQENKKMNNKLLSINRSRRKSKLSRKY